MLMRKFAEYFLGTVVKWHYIWTNKLNMHSCEAQQISRHFQLSSQISQLEKPALTQHGLLQLYSIRDCVCNNSPPTSLSCEGARPAVGQGPKKKEKKDATVDFFSPVLQLFYLYTVFYNAEVQHSCSPVPISNGSF